MISVNTAKIKVDKLLTGVAVRYTNASYVGDQLFPMQTVKKESDKYKIFKRDGFFKGAPIKADGAKTAEASLSYDEGTYQCKERAIKDIVTDRAVQNADSPVVPRTDTTKFLTEKIMLSKEIDQLRLATGTSGLDVSGYRIVLDATTAWVNGTSPDPLKDMSTAIKMMVGRIGIRPNTIIMNTDAAEALAADSTIRDLMKYHMGESFVSGDPLPPTLRKMKVVIADALVNTANEGQTESLGYILGTNCIIAFVQKGHPMNFGVTFNSRPFRVSRWRDDDREGEFIKTDLVYVPKILNLMAGVLIKNVTYS